MIFATINPAATQVQNKGPFGEPTVVSASAMTAMARPYKLGTDKTKFEILYGNVVMGATGVIAFERVTQQEVTLTSDQLSTWGSDDATVLHIIATQVGTTVTDIVSGSNIPGMSI
jgi:N6-adenosine-specific RNA methylase IME4